MNLFVARSPSSISKHENRFTLKNESSRLMALESSVNADKNNLNGILGFFYDIRVFCQLKNLPLSGKKNKNLS